MSAIDPVTVSLSDPVTIGEGEKAKIFAGLVFTRTMRGRDMMAMDAVEGQIKKSFALYASMAGVPIQVFYDMSTDDFEQVARAVAPLMGKRGKAEAWRLAAEETPVGEA